jgi:hypothetical protein
VRLYVAFRRSKHYGKAKQEVLQKLQDNNINVSKLVDWPADDCPSPQSAKKEEGELGGGKEEEEEEEEE